MRNIGWLPGIGAATAFVVRHATTVICVSEYLRRELETKLPEARGKTEVVSSGVDLERFTVEPAPNGPPRFLCVGALEERKNVVRLAEAFAQLGEGTLTFAGDGALREQLAGRDGVRLLGRVPHDDVRGCLPGAHVLCQPSLIEPLGQALLEGLACGRSVVATRIGGPPEFVPPDAGVLVDPLDVAELAAGLAQAAASRVRTRRRARRLQRTTSGRRPPGSRRSSVALRQVREPDLDERPNRVFEARPPVPPRAPAPSSRVPSRDRRPASAGCHR